MGLDTVELVYAVEDAFGISIPDAEAEQMVTPAIMIAYVQDVVASQPERKWTPEEVRQRVRQIISEQLGVKNFKDTDEFVRDLGAD